MFLNTTFMSSKTLELHTDTAQSKGYGVYTNPNSVKVLFQTTGKTQTS